MTTSQSSLFDTPQRDLAGAPAFIEHQFPVARVSMESYKERSAKQGQTLTGLGKWWGRKPLVLVRAVILGLLMPASDDPIKDRDIFLKLLTMDSEGLVRRKSKSIPTTRLVAELREMAPSLRRRFLSDDQTGLRPKLNREGKQELQRLVFERMPYAEKLEYCDRPEQIDGPSATAWAEINAHLGTNANSLAQLVEELGVRRFGRTPRVGDAFCGGGSIPFEAARLGCEAYGSDLNPVAALLTWASLNIVGGGPAAAAKVREAQQQVFEAVDSQMTEWGIEHNEQGWRADAYLYCVEVIDPESGWRIPLAPSWVIGEKTNVIAKLVPDPVNRCYSIEIHEGVPGTDMLSARDGTVRESRLVPPNGGPTTPIESIRRNLRMWDREDIVPRPDDVFQERLYCIRWVETIYDDEGNIIDIRRHYRAPSKSDLRRENRVLALLRERFDEWQSKGFVPSRLIEPGIKTDEPIRTRGWAFWHQLFAPRQLLLMGLFMEKLNSKNHSIQAAATMLLSLSRGQDYNSKLCRWHPRSIGDKSEQTFSNQALNTLYNYAVRSTIAMDDAVLAKLNVFTNPGSGTAIVKDARIVDRENDIWITDPPYADAISYHELSEFFLAWYEKQLPRIFLDWYSDSKRALAVKGNDQSFRQSMVECYRNLAEHMPDGGFQVVMFTHQDAAVWADLSMILWAAGLRVTAAWNIATETESSLKQGNYVQGTVILVLRKRTDNDLAFLDEVTHDVEVEVKRQLDTMLALEDSSEPNFADADYQLAAYAAALRVLTERPIDEIDPAKEIARERRRGEIGPVEKVIRNAVKIACDHLVPLGFDSDLWKDLSSMERFYLKGLEVESHGEYRNGVYQELARGFGAADYTELLAGAKANETRLKSPSELKNTQRGDFGLTLTRTVLAAIFQAAKREDARAGLHWLKTELHDYWGNREKILLILDYLAALRAVASMPHWREDAEFAALVAGAVRNDHI